ncbi:MAG TPA: amino acid adenylation domain-containing protein [Candidatus Sulfotelmatobacter sp.]|nr:amino acid adenylation domain-containing protein [Candidatus Sulfotelmatobacter sp.]
MSSSTQPISRTDRSDRELSLYHLLDPEVVANPYPLFRKLREEDPVHWDPFLHAWVVTRYPEVLEVLHTFSADRTPTAEQLDGMGLARLGPIARVMVKQMLFMDAPAHTRLRGLASKAFMPARVELLRSHIKDIVNRLLDQVEGRGRMDVIADLAEPLPAIVTAEMLGVPVSDRHKLKQWSANFAEMLGNFQHNPDHVPLMLQTVEEMAVYFQEQIREIKAHPREGLIHSLLTAEIDGDRLSEEEVVANTIVTMVGGQETTTNLIGNGLLTMLRNPEEMQRLRNNLSLIPSAVEEMLRYESPSQHTARLAPEDRELGGKQIQKRQAVIAVMAAANRDPERFPDPDRFDITRQDNRHLAFGYAAHFCFGAPLARAEGQVAFEALLRRFPNLRLEPQQLQWRTNSGLRGLNSLKVAFDGNASSHGPGSDGSEGKSASVPSVDTSRAANSTSRLSDAKRSAIESYLKGGFAKHRIPRRSEGRVVPLSCAQEQIWLHTQLAPDVPMYNEAVIIDRKGPLDIGALERSLSEIMLRHEAWRTNFEMVDGQPVQVVREPQPITLPVVDLRHLPVPERELKARSLAEEQTRKPFDLKQDLLIRATLLRLTDDDHQLVMTLHHIVFDGLSIYDVFLPEFMTLYRAYSSGASATLRELPIRYTDFATWQKDRQLEGPLCQQMDYWRQQLSGDVPVLQLPTDRPRPAVQTYRGAMHAFRLPKNLSDSLRQASQREGATVFMTLLAAFATLLHRYTGQDDFVVGTVSAGRKETELQGLLGCFQNPMALRVDVSGDPSFRELQKRARKAILGALSHDDVPFGTLVQELQPERDLSRSPILQVLLSLAPSMPKIEPGWDLKQMAVDVGAAKFDLDLELDDRPDGIRGRFVYNTDLFDAVTIARTVGHWETLLQSIVDNPDQPISTIPLLTASEKAQLAEWNRTETEYPSDKCIHQLVEAQAARTPAAIAVQQEKRALTYSELNARANQLAHYLRKRGVGSDVPVGICLPSSPEMMIALLGVLKAGAACVPLDPKYPQERLTYMTEDAKVPVLIADSRTAENFPGATAEVVNLVQDWAKIGLESSENLRVEMTPENLAYLIYTSGSTGKPRGVELTHRGLVNHNTATVRLYGLRAEDCVLQFSSISFDIAVEEIFPAWISGARLVLKTEDMPLTAGEFLRWIRARKISVLDLPTAYWHELVHQLSEAHQALPEKLRLVIVGGEKASSVSLAAWRKLVGDRVRWVNTYGPTEASVIATAYEPTSEFPSLLPIGRPIANTQIHILNAGLQQQPVGIRGELHIGGKGVARGYLNRAEMTAAKFIADPFTAGNALLYKTGDMARYLPDGNIEFLGRTDDQVKVRGFRVELGEIEALLGQCPGIDMAVVAAREDARGEKALVAYFVPTKEPSPTGNELRSFLQERLPEHMLPSSFVKLDTMPLTPNGKVDRRALPEPSAADSAAEESLTAPKDALESQLVTIWQSILGKHPIGVRQSFFDLGGHSLLAVRLMHRLEQVFGKKMPITTLFQAPTIEHMAELLRTKGWAPSWSSLVPIQPLGSKPPLFLAHGAGGTVIIYRDLARHLGPDQPVYGLQAQGLDGSQTCLSRVEDMASHYLKAIRTIQPEGPYFLGGLSFGGTVAFEMARQLRAQGEEVALLALFDTFPGKYEAATSLLLKLGRMPARDQLDYIQRKTGQYARNWKRRIDRMFLPQALKNVRRGIQIAGEHYSPHPYPGDVTLFRASEKSLRGARDSAAGWNGLAAGKLEIFEIPGGHVSILSEPQVQVLAGHLATCIEKVQTARLVPQLCER